MKKKLLIFTLFFMMINSLFVISISEEPYCYAGSDYYVIQHGNYPPELIALYDNTQIFFDINNDGIWEYRKTINKNTPYYPTTNWNLKDGSLIHSNKPIVYNQKIYSSSNDRNYQCIPPINALRNEIVLYPVYVNNGLWKIISPNATINIIDKNNVLTTKNIESSITINIPDNTAKPTDVWYINSTKPIIATSNFGFSSRLDTDFIKSVSGTTMIVTIEDNTLVEFDLNSDGIFDESEIMNRGNKEFDLTAGTRIKSNKKIGVFEREWWAKLDYSQCIPTKSVNDELFLKIHAKGRIYVTGLFNDDDGFNNTFYQLTDGNTHINDAVISNGVRVVSNSYSNIVRIKADKPVSAFYKHYYSNSYYKFQRPFQTIEPYITSFSKLKFIGLNDSAIINVRVLNPTSYDLDDVKVTIRYLDVFPTINVTYYFSIRNLDGDSPLVTETPKTSPTLTIFGVKEFTINLGTILAEEYADINYYLKTPTDPGIFNLPKATLEFNSNIWTIT